MAKSNKTVLFKYSGNALKSQLLCVCALTWQVAKRLFDSRASAAKGVRKCCKAKQLRSKVFVLFRIFTLNVQLKAIYNICAFQLLTNNTLVKPRI